MKSMRLTKEQIEELKEMYVNKDITVEEMAKAYEVNVYDIYNMASKYKLKRLEIKIPKEKISKLIELYKSPYTTRQDVADYFGTSVQYVSGIASRYGAIKGRLEDAGLRKCSKCKETLELNHDNFKKSKMNKYGYQGYCRKCANEYRKEYTKRLRAAIHG